MSARLQVLDLGEGAHTLRFMVANEAGTVRALFNEKDEAEAFVESRNERLAKAGRMALGANAPAVFVEATYERALDNFHAAVHHLARQTVHSAPFLVDAATSYVSSYALSDAPPSAPSQGSVHIVFDGPPDREAGRFVEVEDANGRSIRLGEWHRREDGYWELRFEYKDLKAILTT